MAGIYARQPMSHARDELARPPAEATELQGETAAPVPFLEPGPLQVAALQRSAGNRSVARWLSGRRGANAPSGAVLARDAGFDTLGGATPIAEAAAPVSIQLPKELEDGLKAAWAKSFPGGKSQEHVGILVQKKDGSYAWKAGPPGTSGSSKPNYGDVGKDERLVASAHTHPYDASEGNKKDVSFSGADLANLVTQDERVKAVYADTSEFVVAKTKEFDARVKDLDTTKKAELKTEMKKLWNDTYSAAKGTFQERVEAAVKAVCEKYDLVYYAGASGGKLTRKTPKVAVTPTVPKAELDTALAAVGATAATDEGTET